MCSTLHQHINKRSTQSGCFTHWTLATVLCSTKTKGLAQEDKWKRETDTLQGFPLILRTFIITGRRGAQGTKRKGGGKVRSKRQRRERTGGDKKKREKPWDWTPRQDSRLPGYPHLFIDLGMIESKWVAAWQRNAHARTLTHTHLLTFSCLITHSNLKKKLNPLQQCNGDSRFMI